MKSILYKLTSCIVALVMIQLSYAQCPNNNIQWGSTNSASWSVGTSYVLTYCIYGGEYRYVYGLQAGSVYSFETCGDSDFDTQISVYDASTGASLAYNDDFCGLQSKVSFTSNGNPVRVLVDRYYCGSQSSCMTLRGSRVTGAPAVNPCNSISSLSCGSTGSFSLSGSGAWNPPGPWGTPGAEKVFSFTATISGSHSVAVTNSGYYVDLFYKSGSCSSSGWTYVDDIYTSGTNSISLTAGNTYYFLIDDENTSASSGTISITCPTPAANPCNSITSIASCGSSASFSLFGNGAWNPPGPWGTPGEEAVFSYTATYSGAHPITVTNSGYYVDLFYKSSSCGASGWTYVSDIYSNETNNVNLTAGVTYLFLIDDENTSASSGTITIGCPCIPPPGGIDGSYSYSGPFTISGTTIGACNDCSLRSSNERVYEVNIAECGNYTFTTCGGASWDTYLYLRSAPCGGSSIALNDDACGLQSSVSAFLTPGSYYIHVEGWSTFSQGSFNLSVSGTIFTPEFLTTVTDVSCNGKSDGSISVFPTVGAAPFTYMMNAASQTSNTFGGLPAGSYDISISDANGCNSATQSITVNEPPLLVADAGPNAIVYYGYAPMACATAAGSATGGVPPYTYAWSDGQTTANATFCPSVTTTYTLVVTDANGCTASDQVKICAVNVICYAGNSGNQKVAMCHVTGNGSSHTICISPDAVPDHLAHGDQLGACGVQISSCGSSNKGDLSANQNAPAIQTLDAPKVKFEAIENPFSNQLRISASFPNEGNYQIVLTDVLGKNMHKVFDGTITSSDNQIYNLSTAHLPTGLYVIRAISSENNVLESRIIVKQ